MTKASLGVRKHDRVKIRNTHPALYRSIRVISVMNLALAVNFWTSNPTFNPFGIHKNLIGVVFALLGLWLLFFIHGRFRSLPMVRLGQTFSFVFAIVWGFANAQQSFAGKASFQLPILYLTLGVIQRYWLTEAPVNPTTRLKAE